MNLPACLPPPALTSFPLDISPAISSEPFHDAEYTHMMGKPLAACENLSLKAASVQMPNWIEVHIPPSKVGKYCDQ